MSHVQLLVSERQGVPHHLIDVPSPLCLFCRVSCAQLPVSERQGVPDHLIDLRPPPSARMLCAQLPVSERQGVPHHLIDVRDVDEDFSAGDFHDLARQAAREIIAVRQGGGRERGREQRHSELLDEGGWWEGGVPGCVRMGDRTWNRVGSPKPLLRGIMGGVDVLGSLLLSFCLSIYFMTLASHQITLSVPLQRGRVPIVVGGTGFYLRWFTHGKAQGPRATPEAVEAVKLALQKVC